MAKKEGPEEVKIGRSIIPLQTKSIWCQFESDSIFKAIAKYTHARTRLGPKMGALQIGRSMTPLHIESIWCQFESDSIFKPIAKYTHAGTRLGAKMGALRKLITEENNGSRDAPTTMWPRDADSR